MKIKKLMMKNLASFSGEKIISFDEEPLKSACLFAITGETGSGKSTILQAISLALYGVTSIYNRKTDETKNSKLTDNKNKAGTYDPSNILRRDEKEGYSKLIVIGNDGFTYRFEWLVRQRSGKNEITKKIIRIDGDTETELHCSSRVKDIFPVENYIGLTYEQFSITVMLAQGDFANFLKLNSNEKSLFLEKLTHTEIFAQTGEIIFDKTREAKQSVGNKEIICNEYRKRVLDDEELSKYNERYSNLSSEINEIEEKITTVLNKSLKIEAYEKAKTALDDAIKKRNEALALVPAIKIDEERIEKYDRMHDAERILHNLEICENNLKSNNLNYISIVNKYINTAATYGVSDIKILPADVEMTVCQNIVDKITDSLDNIRNEYIKTADRHQEKMTMFNNQIEDIKKQISDLNINDLNKKRDIQKEKKDKLSECITKLDEGKSVKQKIDTNTEEIRKLENIRTELSSKCELLQKQIDTKSMLLEEQKKRENLYRNYSAQAMRQNLKGGECCPVCGSKDHPFSCGEFYSLVINDVSKDIETIQADLANLNSQMSNPSKTGLKDNLIKTESDINSLKFVNEQYNTKIESLRNWWRSTKILFPDIEISDVEAVTKNIKDVEKEIMNYDKSISLYHSLQEKLDTLREQNEKEIQNENKNRNIANQIEHTIQNNKQQIEISAETIKTTNTELQKHCRSLSSFISEYERTNGIGLTRDEISHIINDKEIPSLRKKVAEYRNTIEVNEKMVESRQKEAKCLSENLPVETKEELTNLSASLNEQKRSISEELGSIKEKISNDQKNRSVLEKEEDELEQLKTKCNKWIAINTAIGSKKGQDFRRMVQSAILSNLLTLANKELHEMMPRYSLSSAPNSMTIDVIDHDRADEKRVVSSLSGGETFIVSLAMSLALGELNSVSNDSSIMFIDEGFGSLDSNYLEMVLDALDKLHNMGKKQIGVISHTTVMKEKIRTQIAVKKQSSNGSSTISLLP